MQSKPPDLGQRSGGWSSHLRLPEMLGLGNPPFATGAALKRVVETMSTQGATRRADIDFGSLLVFGDRNDAEFVVAPGPDIGGGFGHVALLVLFNRLEFIFGLGQLVVGIPPDSSRIVAL